MPSVNTPLDRLRNWMRSISPISIAISLTAIAAATLFTTYDAFRTLDDAQVRLRLVASAVAAEIAATPPERAAFALLRSAQRYEPGVVASLRDPFGAVLATTRATLTEGLVPAAFGTAPQTFALTEQVGAGALGTLDVQLDPNTTLRGVWQRGGAVFGLAFLVMAASFRRREPGQTGRKQRRGIEDLISTIPFGVACWTPAGEMIVCNEQYKARLNIRDADARPGSSYQAAVKSLVFGGYVRLVNEDDSNRLLEFHREDGSILLIDERPLNSGGFVTLVTDVTERKRTDVLLNSIREEQRLLARRYHEEKLKAEAASRSKTSFLAHLSHDIRTPLNHIIGFADLLRHQAYGPLGDLRYLEYANTIKESGERLLASFATILDLAELEGGQKTLREERLPVSDLMQSISERFRSQALRAGLSFVVKTSSDAVLMGDRFCLERMLGNVVENAVRFTQSGGRVTVAAFAASDGVVLEITDTGIGMSEEKLASLAQPFVFGDATFTKDTNDSGLGIAIARAIAELSGGRLAIDSSPALGTTVAISLPLRAAAEARAA